MTSRLMIAHFAFLFLILWSPFVHPALKSDFVGEWCYEEYTDKSELPYVSFDIAIHQDKRGRLAGQYCSISYYGNRIDCDANGIVNVRGTFSERKNQVNVLFSSSFGGKNGHAVLYFFDNKLHWRVDKDPVGGSFYGPYSAVLAKCGKASPVFGVILSSKEYLRDSPSDSASTKAYLKKGDRVSLLSVSPDTRFFEVRYNKSNGKDIDGWIRYEEFGNLNE